VIGALAEATTGLAGEVAQLIQVLDWRLGALRLSIFNPNNKKTRKAIWQERGRVFTLLTGIRNADPVVIARAVTLAVRTNAPDTKNVEPRQLSRREPQG
jgi:hypothetical protein